MTNNRFPPLYAIAILLYTFLFAFDLFLSWTHSPFEYYIWIPFTIWILPIPLFWLGSHSKSTACNPTLLVAALITSTLGLLGSINALQHVGFAIALTALLPFSWNLFPWFLTSISWMPAMGWVASHTFPNYNLLVRILLATIGTIWILIFVKERREA